jgi:transposase InsO family protein
MGRKRYSPEQIIAMLQEAQVIVEGWRKEYHRFKPHSSLGYRPPNPETHVVGIFTLGLPHRSGAGQRTGR